MKIHFNWNQYINVSACGAEQKDILHCTPIRKKVTCGRCKNTKGFKKTK